MNLISRKEHNLSQTFAKEQCSIFFVEVATNLYYVEKDRVNDQYQDSYVTSDVVAKALNCVDKVGLLTANDLYVTEKVIKIKEEYNDEKW